MATLEELLAQADSELGASPSVMPTPVSTPTVTSATPSVLGSYLTGAKQGVLDLPANLFGMVKDVGGLASEAFAPSAINQIKREIERQQLGLNPLQYALMKVERGAETVGRGASQLAGAGVGAIGGPVGSAVGAGIGDVAFTSLVDALTGKAPTSLEEKAYQAGYGTGGAAGGEFAARRLPSVIEASQRGTKALERKVTESVGPQTYEGALAELGKQKTIKEAYPEAILAQRIKEMKKTPIQVQTSAELYPTGPGAMIEKAIAGQAEFQLPYNKLRSSAEEIGSKKLLESMLPSKAVLEAPETLGAYELGEVKREALVKGDQNLQATIESLYAPIDKKYSVTKWGPAKTNITKAIETYAGGDKYVTGEFKTLIEDIRGKKEFTVGNMQVLRSKALSFERGFKDVGDRGLAKVANTVAEQLRNMIEKTPTGAKDWKAANAAAAPLLKLRNEGPLGGVLLERNLTSEKLLNKVAASKSSVKQYKELIQDEPSGVAALQTYFVNELIAQTPAARAAYIKQKKGALQEAFGGDFETLDALQQQQKRYAQFARLSTPLRGSQTAPLAELSPKIGALVSNKAPQSPGQLTTTGVAKGLAGALVGHTIFPGGVGEILGYQLAQKLGSPFERSSRLQKQALYDIATNPEKAIKAQQLARALEGKEAPAFTSPVATSQLQQALTGATGAGVLSLPRTESVYNPSQKEELLLQDVERLLRETPSGDPLEKTSAPVKQNISALISEQPLFIQAMIQTESSNDPKAESKKKAYGLMQLMPGTAEELGVDPKDPTQNIEGGTRYINQMIKQFGDTKLALAAYNWGPGNLQKAIAKTKKEGLSPTWDNILQTTYVPTETRKYVTKVITKRNQLEA
jgi:soluble lytic murein transglycosylase-like protein